MLKLFVSVFIIFLIQQDVLLADQAPWCKPSKTTLHFSDEGIEFSILVENTNPFSTCLEYDVSRSDEIAQSAIITANNVVFEVPASCISDFEIDPGKIIGQYFGGVTFTLKGKSISDSSVRVLQLYLQSSEIACYDLPVGAVEGLID